MPFRRLDSLADAERTVWLPQGDPRLPERIRLVWSIAARLAPRRFEPGVRRFRSIEEMNQADSRALREHIKSLRAQREAAARAPADHGG